MADYSNPNAGAQTPGTMGTAPTLSFSGGAIVPTSTSVYDSSTGAIQAPSTTFDASRLSQPQQNTQFPPTTDPTTSAQNAMASNASVPYSAPAATEPADTAAQTQQTGILGQIANLMKGKQSLATLQTGEEAKAGVPGMQDTINTLTDQLTGINDQSAALSNASDTYGSIQNAQRLAESGGNIGALGGRAQVKQQLLENNIKLNSLSAQSLTVKSTLLAAQNKFSSAKLAADKAAQVTFDSVDQEINYKKALLDQLAPTLSRDEKTQAAQLSQQLDQQSKQAEYGRQDMVAGLGLINTALVNSQNDPAQAKAAQYAISQAHQLDPKDPGYLQKVYGLVGQFQKDPLATQKAIMDLQLTRAQINSTNALATQRSDTSPAGGVAGNASDVASGIISGNIPPDLSKNVSFKDRTAVNAELARQGYNLTKAEQDWTATQKLLSTLNGAQQTRLRQAIGQVDDSLGLVSSLSQQWSAGGLGELNKVRLAAAKQGLLGQNAQSLAVQLDAEIGDVTSELGTVYKGGNSSTDESLKLAASQLNSNWSNQTLQDAVKLARANIQYRKNSLSLSTGGIQDSQYNQTGSSAGAVKLKDAKTGEVRTFTGLSQKDLQAALGQGYQQVP